MTFRALILLLAIGAGGAAAWLAFALQSSAAPTPAVVEPEQKVAMQEVLVATVDLDQGETITAENVRWQAWPEGLVHPAFISRSRSPGAIEALQGSVVRDRLVSGEPVRQDKLAQSGSGFLSTILPAGKRAVAVRVTAERSAGGFVLPNDRVDVIQTTSETSASGGVRNVSTTLLTNIRVLAIDQVADDARSEGGSSALIGRTATLELDPRQAEIIVAAEASGMLSLALRSAADADEAQHQHEVAGFVRVVRAGHGETVRLR